MVPSRLVGEMVVTSNSPTSEPASQLALPPGPLSAPQGPRPPTGWYARCKPVLEFSIALVLLILSAPVVFLAALLVKLTSRGPAFYTQTRLGANGKPYTIYKLRTMVHNC